jgi:hypothetical protein
MVEQVTRRMLYQFTCTKPYKQAFVADQKVTIGSEYTPFFGFYESSRQYDVTRPDGTVAWIKAIAFLRQVKDGQINCPNLSQIASEIATHYIMLARELLMEQTRLEDYPAAPSRQRCLYLADTVDEARQWQHRIGEPAEICSIECTGTIHRADANLLLGDSEPLSVTRQRAHAYWRGELSDHPHLETLFVGNATITAVGL